LSLAMLVPHGDSVHTAHSETEYDDTNCDQPMPTARLPVTDLPTPDWQEWS
jgi:hypothetical protein